MARLARREVVSRAFLGSMIFGSFAFLTAAAVEVNHGEMAGAIRSAGFPCAHVLKIDGAGADAWVVECNSGTFRVSRDRDGRFEVTPTVGKGEK